MRFFGELLLNMTLQADLNRMRYIITGGPGSGKSSLIEALRNKGVHCYSEVSRELIRQQIMISDGVMPWNNLPAFARLAFNGLLRQHDPSLSTSNLVFFDRGLPDIFGYLHHGGFAIPLDFLEAHAGCRYNTEVFILPPWPDIYIKDSERPQSYEESEALFHSIHNTYNSLGYTLHEVPKASVTERINYLFSITGTIFNPSHRSTPIRHPELL